MRDRPRFALGVLALMLAGAGCDSTPSSKPPRWDAWTVHGPAALVQDNQLWLWYFGTPAIQSYQADLGLAVAPCGAGASTDPSCQPGAFARSDGNPVHTGAGAALGNQGLASDPTVISENGAFKMWFTNVELSSGSAAYLTPAYATSTDGVVWSDPTYHLLTPTSGSFDGAGIETPAVVHTNTDYKLFYTGDSVPGGAGSDHQAIGMASSADGVNWVKSGGGPILDAANDWESGVCSNPPDCTVTTGGVGEPSVLFDPGSGHYFMWYAGLGERGGVGTFRIGYASSDDGLSWSRGTDPVFEPGPSGAWDDGGVTQPNVIPDPTVGYHLFYFGFGAGEFDRCSQAGGCAFTRGAIGHAYSADGVSWTRDADPVLTPSE